MLYEVRASVGGGRPGRWDPEQLARRYQLDPMIVRALLESEGLALADASTVEPHDDADPNGSTQLMSIDELRVR